jgi:polyisoprenoid-binding protein YceI
MRKLILFMALVTAIGVRALAEGEKEEGKPTHTVVTVTSPEGKSGVDLKEGTSIWLEGNSTLHRFYFTVTQAQVSSEIDPAEVKSGDLLSLIKGKKIHNFTVTIPVESLKSGEEGMDKNAYQTLKDKDCPNIVFRMDDLALKAFPENPKAYALLAKGKLRIGGQERDVVLDATLLQGANGITIYGNQDILQKDYGISPYSAALVMTTDNKIVVHYSIALGLK